MSIAVDVRKMVARFVEKDLRSVRVTSELGELGADSLVRAEIALGLEASFGLDIPVEEATGWRTVGDVVAFVATAVGRASEGMLVEARRVSAA